MGKVVYSKIEVIGTYASGAAARTYENASLTFSGNYMIIDMFETNSDEHKEAIIHDLSTVKKYKLHK